MVNHRTLHWLGGFIADLPTPFDDGDRIDWRAFEKLCEHQIKAGATAIVVGETAGEASTLNREEHEDIIAAAAGRIAVIAGAGSNSTSQAIELTTEAEAAGADAILSVVPYYNRPMQAGMLAHFRAIAGTTGLPIILHDVPSRTMREMSDETILELSQSRQFIGLKESSGSLSRLLRLRSALPPAFRSLSGDDATAMAYLACGGDGCISTVANLFPDLCQEIQERCGSGNVQVARSLASRLMALATIVSGDSPVAALKYGMSLLGCMKPAVRLPLVELGQEARQAVTRAMAAVSENIRAGEFQSGRRAKVLRGAVALPGK